MSSKLPRVFIEWCVGCVTTQMSTCLPQTSKQTNKQTNPKTKNTEIHKQTKVPEPEIQHLEKFRYQTILLEIEPVCENIIEIYQWFS